MSSMLRQHHVKIQDLANFLRGYDPSKPQSAEDWSKTESAGFSPGMLLFCLERVSAPQGLAFGKRDDAAETYRVRDLCVVVGKDNNRPLVVNITASAFELRFLEVLMLEKARKAILDGKDFVYVAAKPAQPLSEGKVREIEQLGALYSQGGSRRTLVVDSAGPQEPAVALLGSLGVKLQIGGIGKQVLDIGSICHMLYTPEGRQEDRNKMIVKQCFLPIPNTHPASGDGLTASGVYQATAPTTSGSNLAATAAAPFQQSSGAEPVWQEPIPPTVPSKAAHSADLYSSPPPKPEWAPVPQPTWDEPSGHGPDLRFSFERTEISTDSSTWQQGGQGYSFPGHPPAEPDNGEPPAAPEPETPPAYEAQPAQPELKYQAPATTPPGTVFHGQADQSETLQHLPGTHLDIQYQMPAPPPEFQYQVPPVPVAMQQYQAAPEPTALPQPSQIADANSTDQFKQDLQQGMAGEAEFDQYSAEPAADTTNEMKADAEYDKVFPNTQSGAGTAFGQASPESAQPAEGQYSRIVQDESQRLDANLLKDISAMAEKARQGAGKSESSPEWSQTAAPDLAPPNWQGFTPTGMAALEITIPPEPPTEEPDWSTPLANQQLSSAPPAVPLPVIQPADTEAVGALSIGVDTASDELDSITDKPKGKTTLFERLNEQFARVAPADVEAAQPSGAAVQETTGEDASLRTPAAPTAEFSITGQPGFAFPGAQQPATLQSGAQANQEASAQTAPIPSFVPPPPVPEAENQAEPPAVPAAPEMQVSSATTSGANQPAVPSPQADSSSAFDQAEPATTSGAEDGTTSGVEIESEDSSYKNLAEALSGIMGGGIDHPSLLDDEPAPAVSPISEAPVARAAEVRTNGGGTEESDADLLAALAGRVTEPKFTPDAPEPPPADSAATPPAQTLPEPAPPQSQSPFAHTAAAAQAATMQSASETSTFSPPAAAPPAEPPVVTSPPTVLETEPATASEVSTPPLATSSQEIVPIPDPAETANKAKPDPAVTSQPSTAPVAASAPQVMAPSVATTEDADRGTKTHTTTQEVAIAVAEAQEAAVHAQEGVFQDPRSVMNEMTTLMNKLEQQVAKAGKKLNSRAEEIKNRLNTQVTELVNAAAEIEKTSQSSITTTGNAQSKKLDDVSEEVRLKISDVASNGRYTIKQMLSANQTQVEESKTALYESLRDVCKQFRVDTEALTKSSEESLTRLVTERTEQLQAMVATICDRLEETNKSFADKLTARFERFTERMAEEAASVVRSLERNVRSMTEEIDGSWDRASDKLKSSKGEFEQTINHTVRTTQLGISHTTRRLLTEALIPKLRERKLILRGNSTDLSRRFCEESDAQANGQLLGLESSLGAARQQLQVLVEDCMSSIDTVGRGQQAGLEEIFKETSSHAEKATTEVTNALQKAETEIRETELACKKLAETSSLDNDPELTEERNSATSRVQQLRQQAISELSSTIDNGCLNLEQLSQKVHTDLTNGRMESTQAVREAAENGVTRLRDAIQEALAAIQGARDKYME